MISFVIGITLLFIYFILKNKEMDMVDRTGFIGILCIIWGMGRYVGTTPKPLWDPN